MSIQSDLKWIKENLVTKDNFKREIDPIKKNIKTIKRTTNRIRKDLEMAVGELDKERDKLTQRVKTIEDNLSIVTPTQN